MKNKKKLLLIIGILLIIVGVSFAYYVMYVRFTGEGAQVDAITKEIGDVTVQIDGNLEFSDTDILPGHKNISSIKLTATGDDKEIDYNLIWNGTNRLSSQLNYTVYKTTQEVDVSISCTEKEEHLIGEIRFYEECSISNSDALGEVISTGTITTSNETRKIVLKENESITATPTGEIVYYYVILEYKNYDSEQTQVTNGGFNGGVTVEQTLGEQQLCGTHNVTTTLGTLAVNDCEPAFRATSINEDMVSGMCLYNGQPVYNMMNLLSDSDILAIEENCGITYEAINFGYLDAASQTLMSQALVGTGTWDDSTDTCTFNGLEVTYLSNLKITEQEHCAEIYTTDGQSFFSGVREVGKAKWNPGYIGTGIYETEDDLGTSYYYRGNVENNYVKFAGFYWRIIRINGNGTIRMIYAGEVDKIDNLANKEEVLKNGYDDYITKYTQIGTSAFNTNYNQAEYVGFKYTLGSVHGTETKSTILEYLEKWYNKNLTNYKTDEDGNLIDENNTITTTPIIDSSKTDYSLHIDIESGFCVDRSVYTYEPPYQKTNEGGIGTIPVYFGGKIRRYNTFNPTLKCINETDYFTVKNSSTGNKSLDYPVGLITYDEVMYAGGGGYANNNYYLYTGNWYWMLSPSGFGGANAYVFDVGYDGSLGDDNVGSSGGVRPVISLSADNLTISGSGTAIDPYVIS